jgi:hypothetical protein
LKSTLERDVEDQWNQKENNETKGKNNNLINSTIGLCLLQEPKYNQYRVVINHMCVCVCITYVLNILSISCDWVQLVS